MATLYQRAWSAKIHTLDVSDLDLEFKIEKSIRREPNTCELRIWNLSESSRGVVSEVRRPEIEVRAGYVTEGRPPVIFRGSARVLHTLDGVDGVTVANGRDGGREYQVSRVSKAYRPGVRVITVLRDAVEALGVGFGNLNEFEDLSLSNGADTFSDGYVAHGSASRVVSDILRGSGLRWSIQNGSIQILRRRQPLQTQAAYITKDSGLIGSPSQDEKGLVTAVVLIQPGIDPGYRVELESKHVRGTFEVRRVSYDGSTFGEPWHATLELRPVG